MRGLNRGDGRHSGGFQSNQRGWRGRPGSGRGYGNWKGSNQASQGDGSKPKLTHFLSIPLGHLPAVRLAAESFGNAILGHTPPIAGLDATVVVAPRRLHLTLGVMSLEEDIPASQSSSQEGNQNTKTLSAALSFLRSLRPNILAALEGRPLRVPFTCIDIMKPERNDPTRAHVLYVGPSDEDLGSEDGQRLKRVCGLVNSEFIKSGFIVDDKRPLKLHCTLINSSNRKPQGKGRRIPFSYEEIRDCLEVQALSWVNVSTASRATPDDVVDYAVETTSLSTEQKAAEADTTTRKRVEGSNSRSYAMPVSLGTHTVSEIQICRMGSWGSEGEYVCIGKIDLLN